MLQEDLCLTVAVDLIYSLLQEDLGLTFAVKASLVLNLKPEVREEGGEIYIGAESPLSHYILVYLYLLF